MIVQDQSEVIAFLSRPESYGRGDAAVERIETHVSEVFLAGGRAVKLKRAVKFPYLDFSTPGLRRAACEAEVRVNARTAPSIYRGVIPVTRDAGGALVLEGTGQPVDWVVDMVRFDENTVLDRVAARGDLDRHIAGHVAERIASFHRSAQVSGDHGGKRAMAAIADNNFRCFAELSAGTFEPSRIEALVAATRQALEAAGPLLDRRREQGWVRHCHGDLHLRNIFVLDGEPTLFDAIEFSEALANIDVLYDLAFLVMDLDHRGLRRLANVLVNRYFDEAGLCEGLEGLRLMPLFLAIRAAIRAHVGAARAASVSDGEAMAPMREEAGRYLDAAISYLSPSEPRLVAVGGLSGSGKSRLAREIAPYLGLAPGARVVRSDVIRKRLLRVPFLSRLGPEGYTAEMTERTFRALFDEVRVALATGYSVIADAVFARPQQRRTIERLAAEAGVPFQGLWLRAPVEVMEQRVRQRRRNVSDATADVIHMQLDYDVGAVGWKVVDSSGSRNETVKRGLAALGLE